MPVYLILAALMFAAQKSRAQIIPANEPININYWRGHTASGWSNPSGGGGGPAQIASIRAPVPVPPVTQPPVPVPVPAPGPQGPPTTPPGQTKTPPGKTKIPPGQKKKQAMQIIQSPQPLPFGRWS